MLPGAGQGATLSLENTGGRYGVLLRAELVSDLAPRGYEDLRRHLWTETSLVVRGQGFEGNWPRDAKARLIAQLTEVEDANYLYCVAIRVNGFETSSTCGTSLPGVEFNTGGLRAGFTLAAPERLGRTDNLELSLVFGSSYRRGAKPVPVLLFGGAPPLSAGYLEIGVDGG